MKGVTSIRAKLNPAAQCRSCRWERGIGMPPATVRASAQRHVLRTGHPVRVTVRDVTEYSRGDS